MESQGEDSGLDAVANYRGQVSGNELKNTPCIAVLFSWDPAS